MKTLAIFMLLLLSGCSWVISDDDPPVEFVTEILEVKISPNPVKLGEMVTFTCIVKDSTNANLEFIWFLSGYQNSIRTRDNHITIEARVLGKNSDTLLITNNILTYFNT
tara:strand:- start:12652 stop:12978 length:327 start_codon:yes stop_codon:yes gene_type:complete